MRCGLVGAVILGAVLLYTSSPSGIEAQVVGGHLLDMEAGTPIVLARMTLWDAEGQAVTIKVTDADGFFLLTAPEPGQYWIEIESPFHEGYRDGPISLGGTDTVSLTFELMPRPVELDALTVETERRSLRLAREGVYDRVEAGVGVHFDRQRLEDRPHTKVSDLIALLPMVELMPDTAERGVRVLFRRRQFERLLVGDGNRPEPCYPQVFLNGVILAVGGSFPGRLDQFSVNDFEAVEVYESPVGLPGRFSGANAKCGTIVLWSR